MVSVGTTNQSIFRSEKMTLCDYFVQTETAFQCVAAIGELGIVQFRDMNENVPALRRKFTPDVQKCNEMERIIRFVDREIKTRENVDMPKTFVNPPVPTAKELLHLETTLEKLEAKLTEINNNSQSLEKNYVDLFDMIHVLDYVQQHMETLGENPDDAPAGGDDILPAVNDTKVLMLNPDGSRTETTLASLNFISGVMHREKIVNFEQMLWRVSRGNIFFRHAEVIPAANETPTSEIAHLLKEQPPKDVFLAFFQGEQLRVRIKKICEAFHATLHTFPSSVPERLRIRASIESRLADLVAVLSQTANHRRRLLMDASGSISVWLVQIAKVKAIYHELNKFNVDLSNNCLIGVGWSPTGDVASIRLALAQASKEAGSAVPSFVNVRETGAEPPTFFRLNKFTSAFQSIVHSYGTANYREINPALYTTITFPFLFAVMFGDMGHGTIMLLAGLFLVIKEKSLAMQARQEETFGIFFGGRYIILLMGAFSIVTGFVYNDLFSKSIKIYPSSWYVDPNETIVITSAADTMTLEPANHTNWEVVTDEPYPFGMDPVWAMASNEIIFEDSMKMKMSVILGVIHMLFGIILSLVNHIYYRRYINIFCEFIPMLLFIMCIFVYMDILIVWKWINVTPEQSSCAPSILIGIINMMLFTYSGANGTCADALFNYLEPLQVTLVLIAVLSVPWLLLSKPLVLNRQHQKKEQKKLETDKPTDKHVRDDTTIEMSTLNAETATEGSTFGGSDTESLVEKEGSHDVHFDFVETLIHQAIHTIEYCLGLVSHTASYLRLWALSLAHTELSQVLWQYLFQMAISASTSGYSGVIFFVVLFAAWACLTVSILVLMEGLSAFLHALRLHWVEFQSKFYGGSGYAFTPFSFAKYREDSDEPIEN